MIDVCLLGIGGMMPLPERPLSASLVRVGGETILFDCGEGTQVNWRLSGWAFRPTGTILLSHLHADHIAGLPGILFQIAHAGRTEPVTIYGPERTAEIVMHLVQIVGRLPYELQVVQLDGGESIPFVAGMTLSTLRLQHHMPCLGYRLDLPRARRFDPDRAREMNVPMQSWSCLQAGETVDGIAPDVVLGPERRGLGLSLITDTSFFEDLVPFVSESDLLISESMYGLDEKADDAERRGHMTARQAARLGSDARVRHLWLTHFSPAVTDLEELGRVAHEECSDVEVGYPGLTTTLRFDEGNRD